MRKGGGEVGELLCACEAADNLAQQGRTRAEFGTRLPIESRNVMRLTL